LNNALINKINTIIKSMWLPKLPKYMQLSETTDKTTKLAK
jgi:hypothetical protein